MNIDPTAVIHGDGITLRRFRADDAQDLAQTAKDPDSQYWTHIPADYTPTMAEEFIAKDGLVWVLTCPEFGDRYCGHIDVRVTDQALGAVSIGYMTAPWARGKGLQSRALSTLAEFLLAAGAHRIEICAATENRASRKVAERAGGVFEGIRRNGEFLDGRVQDLAVYSIIPGDLDTAG